MKLIEFFHASVAALGLLSPAAARAYSRSDGFVIRRNELTKAPGSRLIPVVVGGPQDLFVPNLVYAKVGDVVQFQFSSGNHTVTQSNETSACQPMQTSDPKAIHSGHIPFEPGQKNVGTFTMVVQSTKPMLIYCATGPHCQLGQVMAINPDDDTQLPKYAKASQSTKASVDAKHVVGGIVGTMRLEDALFVPPPPEEE
ncbi:hypothetical protein LLEC1_05509 [Akanthomyces lecanii]|uniref:Blue (type 1) copper domain-containing protein n=1 Tax=Cordyceps confragosa TaxID=2714763 RepID=A0A179IMN9_CORDF|nr:hypothetical protein LLEC1_05509 [Akanthomyces lecanii]